MADSETEQSSAQGMNCIAHGFEDLLNFVQRVFRPQREADHLPGGRRVGFHRPDDVGRLVGVGEAGRT